MDIYGMIVIFMAVSMIVGAIWIWIRTQRKNNN